MLKKILASALVIGTVSVAALATSAPAQANNGGAFFAGAITGLVVGGIAAHNNGYYNNQIGYYEPEVVCKFKKVKVNTYYGWKWKTIKVCKEAYGY